MKTGVRLAPGEGLMPAPQDEDLLALIVEHEPVLRRRAISLTGSASDAGDLAQDTIEKAIRSLARFQRGTNLQVWLMTIMKNLFLDRCRSAKVHKRRLQQNAATQEVEIADPMDESEQPPPWTRVSTEQFHEAIERLDPVLREAFRLRVLVRLPYAEIGKRLGIPVATVGTRLNRSRTRLRRILSQTLGLSEVDPAQTDIHDNARSGDA